MAGYVYGSSNPGWPAYEAANLLANADYDARMHQIERREDRVYPPRGKKAKAAAEAARLAAEREAQA